MVGKNHENNPRPQYAEGCTHNKKFSEFILSNKFEYGHDPEGGAKAGTKERNKSQLHDMKSYRGNPFEMLSNKAND